MGFDKDRRPLWTPGRRDRMFVVAGTSATIPGYGFNLFKASTVAGTKNYKLSNPLPLTGSGGTEVNIIIPNLLTGSSAAKHVIVQSTKTSILFNTTKSYKKIVMKPAGKRGSNVSLISLSTSNYYVLSNTTSVSFSTSST